MARSAEAIKRRAEKRNRSEAEQRQAELEAAKKKQRSIDPMQEPGAWKCTSCGNINVASRSVCHSKTCHEKRPLGSTPPSNNHSHKSPNSKRRHDPDTSKSLSWAPQADAQQVASNQELRAKYQKTQGEGMTPAEIARAKTLIQRDERKKKKKRAMKGEKKSHDKESADEPVKKEVKQPKEMSAAQLAARQRQENQRLKETFQKTQGQGMEEADIARAQSLLAREERKRQKRASLQQEQ